MPLRSVRRDKPETMDGNIKATKRLQTTSEAHADSPEIKSSLYAD
jgi:hypothetical protein